MAWSCSWGHHRTLHDNSLMVDNQYLLATTPGNEQLMEVLSFYTPPLSKLSVFALRAFLKDNTIIIRYVST